MKTVNQIRSALENSEFHMEYMPTVDLSSGQCVGAEALIRWQHGDERVAPDEFIPIIENTSTSGFMTYWIIEEVARDLGGWLRNNDGVHVGINFPPEVLGRGGFEYAAMKTGLIDVVDKIIIEVTERGFPDSLGLAALASVNGRVKIAIDDFGTGDANMMRLSQMPADIIKLDKYFVDQITYDNQQPKIVTGLVAFAKAMDFDIIAEGVESEVQVQALQRLEVNMAQGWYFSKPLPVDEFIKFHQG